MARPIITALFGGTFDPVHHGHLKPAIALAKQVGLSKIYLIPNYIPPHKPQPIATTRQRLDMLNLVTKYNPLFAIDQQELIRESTSYTIDTLTYWRQTHPQNAVLTFIIGTDSLYTIDRWHRWRELLDHCHLLVCPRALASPQTMSAELRAWVNQHLITDITQLTQQTSGNIFIAKIPLQDIASSQIKRRLQNHQDCQDILPFEVWQYIKQHRLYQN